MALNNQRLTEDIMAKVRDLVNKKFASLSPTGASDLPKDLTREQDLKQLEESIRSDLTAVEVQNKAVLLQISSLSKSVENLKSESDKRIAALEKEIASLKSTPAPTPIPTKSSSTTPAPLAQHSNPLQGSTFVVNP